MTIRQDLVDEARQATGLRTKRELVEAGLTELIRQSRIARLRARLGRGEFALTQEDLEQMRSDD